MLLKANNWSPEQIAALPSSSTSKPMKKPHIEIIEEASSDSDDETIGEVIARGNNYDVLLSEPRGSLDMPLPPPLPSTPLNVVDSSMPPMGNLDDLVRTDIMPDSVKKAKLAGRYVCFTVYHFKAGDAPIYFDPDRFNYLVYQKEKCPNTGRVHLQGYVQFKKQTTWSKIKEILSDNGAHLANAAGSPEQNRVYCTKLASRIEGPWEYGIMSRPGKRNDLDDVSEAIKSGRSLREIAMEFPVQLIRYHAGIEKLVSLCSTERDPMFEPTIYVECGAPRSGKSYQARRDLQTKYQPDMCYEMSCNSKGFLYGYRNQKGIMIDEFRGNLSLQFFKSLIHAGRFNVATFGSHMPFLAEEIHICSNYSPELWYKEFTRINDSSLSLWGVLKQVRVWTAAYDRVNNVQTFRLFERDTRLDPDGRQLRDAVCAFWADSGLSVQNPYDDEHRNTYK